MPSAAVDTCEHVLDGVNQDSPLGTLYLSNAIRTLISEGVDFMGVHVPSFACLASQQQLDDFLYHVKEGSTRASYQLTTAGAPRSHTPLLMQAPPL